MSTQLLVFIKRAGILMLVRLQYVWGFGATTWSAAAPAEGWQTDVHRKPHSPSPRARALSAQDGIAGV